MSFTNRPSQALGRSGKNQTLGISTRSRRRENQPCPMIIGCHLLFLPPVLFCQGAKNPTCMSKLQTHLCQQPPSAHPWPPEGTTSSPVEHRRTNLMPVHEIWVWTENSRISGNSECGPESAGVLVALGRQVILPRGRLTPWGGTWLEEGQRVPVQSPLAHVQGHHSYPCWVFSHSFTYRQTLEILPLGSRPPR